MKSSVALTCPKIEAARKTGNEQFTAEGHAMNLTLLDFWSWSTSDLVSNVTRGRLAEFIVAKALGVESGIREEWADYDLVTATGKKIEVKSAAYVQAWEQQGLSRISFQCGETIQYGFQAGLSGGWAWEKKRRADVYVFALLHHTDRLTLDPMNLDQWEFYVLPTEVLNARAQQSVTLDSLRLITSRLKYAELAGMFD
jgi:hypothetical protein